MENKTLTAVEWLFTQLPEHLRLSRDGFEMLNQALDIEKEQRIEDYVNGATYGKRGNKYKSAEQYYTTKYGKQ